MYSLNTVSATRFMGRPELAIHDANLSLASRACSSDASRQPTSDAVLAFCSIALQLLLEESRACGSAPCAPSPCVSLLGMVFSNCTSSRTNSASAFSRAWSSLTMPGLAASLTNFHRCPFRYCFMSKSLGGVEIRGGLKPIVTSISL
jgi:hypothetical protein